MDPISHALVGAAIGGLRDGAAPGACLWAAVAGAVIPDIDFAVRLVAGEAAYLDHHRGPTHGPVGWVAEAGAIAGVLKALAPDAGFGALFLWALAGVLSYVFLDLTNAYGTQALWPLSRRRYAWDWTQVVDLPILALGLGNLTLAWLMPERHRLWGLLVLAGIGLYLAFRAWVHGVLLAAVRRRFPGAGAVSVIPGLVGWNRWRYVAELPDRALVGWVTLRPLAVGEPREQARLQDRVVAASLASPMAQLIRRFSRHPCAAWEPLGDGYRVRWYDLRYEFGSFTPFAAEVVLDPELNLVDDRLSRPRPDRQAAGLLLREALRGRG
ncbi:MAG: metal-dependent hydrolase [Bacillota bacterium]